MRPLDIGKDQHRHSFEKYQIYERFVLEENQYDELVKLLKGNIGQMIVEIETPYHKGVIVAKQDEPKHWMYYVFDMEGSNYTLHAFNYKEAFLFSIQMVDGDFVTKDVNPLLKHMPIDELRAFQGFASNYYNSLMFYLSNKQQSNGLSCAEEKYLKKEEKRKEKDIEMAVPSTLHIVAQLEAIIAESRRTQRQGLFISITNRICKTVYKST
jgi:hypothetical protein